MRRIVRLVIVLSVLAALAAPAAVAAERMWIGFHDDPSFRWVGDRRDRVQGASQTNATIMRLLVQWNLVAKTRPSSPTSPFDPAYNFDDIDEAVRAAQDNDQEVVLTLSGTPRWANGGKSPNLMPRRVADFTSFARAIASRYSGRFEGYPFVRFFSVWNEPNLTQFLAPQFNGQGRSVAPANYAKLAAAAYTGIKAGNRQALVSVGETSARGSDKPTGLRPNHTPGTFAELVAKANPRLRFDAWSHHPYPFNPNSPPTQRVRWPNVSLALLPRFDAELKSWFKRKSVPIWITEYGHQTRPEDALGDPVRKAGGLHPAVDVDGVAVLVRAHVHLVHLPGRPRARARVGVRDLHARRQPEGAVPGAVHYDARPLDARNGVVVVPRGTLTPLINVHTRRYCSTNSRGTPVGMTWRVFRGGRLISVGQQTAPLRNDCTIAARIRVPGGVARGQTYIVTFDLNNASGVVLNRRITLRAAS